MKKIILAISMVVASIFMMPTPVMAGTCSGGLSEEQCNKICSDTELDAEQKAAAGCNTKSDDTVVTNMRNIINSAIAGISIVAVIVIIMGGQRLVFSSGDAGKINEAKNMIIYAAVALVVAVLAWAIISFATGAIGK